jgi:hypothetical protein
LLLQDPLWRAMREVSTLWLPLTNSSSDHMFMPALIRWLIFWWSTWCRGILWELHCSVMSIAWSVMTPHRVQDMHHPSPYSVQWNCDTIH